MGITKDDLGERVQQFQATTLPGQPAFVHVGTYSLVMDLWREVQRLRGATCEDEGCPHFGTPHAHV